MGNIECADAFTGHILKLDTGELYFRVDLSYMPKPMWLRHYRDNRGIVPLNYGPITDQLTRLWEVQQDTTPTQQQMREA